MSKSTTLRRVFRVGGNTLPDPDPSLEPEAAFRLATAGWADVSQFRLEGPTPEGDLLVYTGQRPPVQTKGARRAGARAAKPVSKADTAMKDAMAALDAWADAPSTASFDQDLHRAVGGLLLGFLRRPSGQVDPFSVSMA